ncbi:TetR/AcrR family transcriptional regulator C-terminal domain-containing protein [Mycobacterium sp. ITM-2016-00316]|uniref:TetR/AcrR family transcriptional regulator C-terminal domain-containing protein n=1 Tax=Mycobacterium sp. ITM-2016-00316 TaxID=2099695 RepID=UPI00115AB103|nr:TetR/AcrR family transcriptional regulator C-terminal domain-containing protein [Mycobacterium sp. ITM-2016-00316]WNG81996.1 TetR/AcrR family transcriptional regulator C-terminal domain-containing protein [Mycobacterium sp. ITM-2016-00316]
MTNRQRGRPRQISRERIVSAARDLPPEGLTMQAVAGVLGVDPKALNYHVGDREGLRGLVALDVFESELRRVELPADGDWRVVARSFAGAIRDAYLKVGVLAASFHLPAASGLTALAPVETLLQALVDAGFDAVQAGRALTQISDTAYTSGRAAVLAAQSGVHPNVPEIADALEHAADKDFSILRQVIESTGADQDGTAQFEFSLAVVIAGLEGMLT